MAQYSDTNLIVNYLPQDLSDEQLYRLFDSRAPGVKSVKICRNNATGYSYGYGFCDYQSHEAAARAIDILNGHQLGRKTLKVAFARLRSEETRNCKLHVSCLPLGTTEEAMRSVLATYGRIISCRLLPQQQQQQQLLPGGDGGSSRGLLGFCLFETHSSAQAALSDLHNRPWPVAAGSGDAQQQQQQLVQVRFADENEKKVRAPFGGFGGGGRGGNSSGGGGRPYHQQQQQQQQFYRPQCARQRGGGVGGYGGGGNNHYQHQQQQQQQQYPAWYNTGSLHNDNYC